MIYEGQPVKRAPGTICKWQGWRASPKQSEMGPAPRSSGEVGPASPKQSEVGPAPRSSREMGSTPRSSREMGPASPKQSEVGQTMLLTVMLITSVILSSTAISALLVLFQLRQVSDVKASTQAIFAADSGLECILYEKVRGGENYSNCGATGEIKLDNGASYVVISNDTGTSFKSVGRAGRSARALEIGF